MEYKVNQVVFNNWKIVKKLETLASGYEIQNTINRKYAILRVIEYEAYTGYDEKLSKERIEKIKTLNQSTIAGICPFVKLEQYKFVQKGQKVELLLIHEKSLPFKEYCKQTTDFGQEQVLKMGIELSQGLQICEEKNILHKAINPENVFVDENGRFQLAMFAHETLGISVPGFENIYFSPEHNLGLSCDKTSDIYSLGLLLYECLNDGRLPFYDNASGNYKQAIAKRMQGTEFPKIDGIDKDLMDIVRKACAFEPEQRYMTAASFERVLKSVATRTGNLKDRNLSNDQYTNENQHKGKKVSPFVVLCCVLLVTVLAGTPLLVGKIANKNKDKEKQTTERVSKEEELQLQQKWQASYLKFTGTMSNNEIDYLQASLEETAVYLKNSGYIFENVAGNWKTDVFYKTSMEKNDTIHARYLFEKNIEEFNTANDLYIDTKITDNSKYRKVMWFADYQESRLNEEQVIKASVIPHRNQIILRYGQEEMLKNLGIDSEMLEWAKGNPVWQDENGNQWYCKNTQKEEYGIMIDTYLEIGYKTEDGKKYYIEHLFGEGLLVGIGECKWK